jgi:release factor glutamine methyltransferase
MTIGQQIEKIKHELRNYYSPNEIWTFIYLIFKHVADIDKTTIHAHPELELSEQVSSKIKKIIRELKSYKPIQYILGQTEFYGLPIKVNPNVLIPRPETEELVALVIEENKGAKGLNIIDIGTGSGCIAIALAKNLPGNRFFATDLKSKALEVAKINAELNEVNIHFQLHDIIATYPPVFNGKKYKYDIIVSNPPYVLPSTKAKMSKTVLEYEPEDALFVPENEPLIFYEAICYFAQHHAAPNAKIYLEINELLDRELVKMLHRREVSNFSIIHDLNGKSRILKITL